MSTGSKLMEEAKGIIENEGREAIEKAKLEILGSKLQGGVVSSALKYFARVTLRGGLPVFPALTSLSCEAVGGNMAKTTPITSALTLIAGAADIHDDIIDGSKVKYSKRTVLGKFGADVALLAGDALLIQGAMLLNKECKRFPYEQSETILNLVTKALFEISAGEAKEASLMGKTDIVPSVFLEVIKAKAVVPELHCKIGGLLGGGDEKSIEVLGHFGRTFGVVSIIRDEFIDLFELPELENRMKNECPPLPVLYASLDAKVKTEAQLILTSNSEEEIERIIETILDTNKVKELKNQMISMVNSDLTSLSSLPNSEAKPKLTLLLKAILEGL